MASMDALAPSVLIDLKDRASLDAATSDVVDIVDRTPSAELQN